MPDPHGVPVWRVDHEGFPTLVQRVSYTSSAENAESYVRACSKVGVSHIVTSGRWVSENLAAAQLEIADAAIAALIARGADAIAARDRLGEAIVAFRHAVATEAC